MLIDDAIRDRALKRDLAPLVAFGPFLLDTAARTLTFQTQTVAIGPREFDLLAFFVHSSGQVIAKNEILRALWPKHEATEGAMQQAIYRLRLIMLRYDPKQRYIASIPSRGYQFVCPVRSVESALPNTKANALQLYRRAMHRRVIGSRTSILESIQLFAEALEEDPDFFEALIGITEAYTAAAHLRIAQAGQAFAHAREHAVRALSSDAFSADAHAVLSMIFLLCDRDKAAAFASCRHALKLSPTSPYAKTAAVWEALARQDFFSARSHAEDLFRAAPGVAERTVLLGVVDYYSGKQDEAYAHLTDALELEPANERAQQFALCSLCASRRYSDAESLLERLGSTKNSPFGLAMRDYIGAKMERSIDLTNEPLYQKDPMLAALASIGAGRLSAAHFHLRRARNECDPGIIFARIDPLYANARV